MNLKSNVYIKNVKKGAKLFYIASLNYLFTGIFAS